MMFKCLARFRQSLSSLEKTKSGSALGVAEFNRAKFCFFLIVVSLVLRRFRAEKIVAIVVTGRDLGEVRTNYI